MTVDRNAFLKKWKQDLLDENERHQAKLENLNRERQELRIKKEILSRVVMKYSNEPSIEDFKKTVQYADIVEELTKCETVYNDNVEDTHKLINYNKVIIDDINESLRVGASE